MFVLQVPPTSFIHKMAPKEHAGQILYRTLSLNIYGGGNICLDRDMEKPERSHHFPERSGCPSWFFIMSAGTKSKYTFRLSSPVVKKG